MSSHPIKSIHPESQIFEPQASCSGTAWEAQGIGAWPRSETCAALGWNCADGLSIGTRASFEFVDGHSFLGTNFSNSEESELDADTPGHYSWHWQSKTVDSNYGPWESVPTSRKLTMKNQVFIQPTILHHPSDIAENSEKKCKKL